MSRLWLLIACLHGIVACSEGLLTTTDDATPAAGGDDLPAADSDGDPDPDPSNGGGDTSAPGDGDAVCPAGARSGSFVVQLVHDGRTRRAIVDVPAAPLTPRPVVLNFHGYGANAAGHAAYTDMIDAGLDRGFVVVHPEGSVAGDGVQSWNAERCCGDAMLADVDDVGFVSALLDELLATTCADPTRIFVTGISNGGFLTYRLACELAWRIAAIAPVAAGLGVTACAPSRAVPVLHIHGTADTLVPYYGAPTYGWPSAASSVGFWTDFDACPTSSTTASYAGGVGCQRAAPCAGGSETRLCTVSSGGHTWPGAAPIPSLGATSSFDATGFILDFFLDHAIAD
jgi:polyhydroxybutyrate depolymerase